MSIALSGLTAVITAAAGSLTSWLVRIWERGRGRKRERRDSALAAARRLIELMSALTSSWRRSNLVPWRRDLRRL